MQQANITIIIDGSTYNLNPTEKVSIKSLPIGDRRQLITLLEAIQLFEKQRHASARQAEGTANAAAALAATKPQGKEPLGKGDVDQLMAQLVMEEKNNRKPGLTQQGLYKWMGISVAVVIFLIVVF
jgi:hypothetical protein